MKCRDLTTECKDKIIFWPEPYADKKESILIRKDMIIYDDGKAVRLFLDHKCEEYGLKNNMELGLVSGVRHTITPTRIVEIDKETLTAYKTGFEMKLDD